MFLPPRPSLASPGNALVPVGTPQAPRPSLTSPGNALVPVNTPQGFGGAVGSVQSDPKQLVSLIEFTDSLVKELQDATGTPDEALMRELLAQSLRRALDLAGQDPKKRFLDALTGNIHKFPLQEQQSLARVFPVEISSEYANLQPFVHDTGVTVDPYTEDGTDGALALPAPGSIPAIESGAVAVAPMVQPGLSDVLEEVRATLKAMPASATAIPTGDDVSVRILEDPVTAALQNADPKTKAGFFSDLRLNLFKLPESSQRELVEKLPELKVEVARLVESMTQEISRWLDDERAVVQNRAANLGALLARLKQLFDVILSAPFLATFKLLGGSEKRCKESFLLKVALCLRACTDKGGFQEANEQADRLRRQFFYVEGYGVLMEDWLQNRIRQFNEDFFQRVVTVTGSSLSAVLARLRRTFRPGRWLSLADPQLEDDIYSLFLDETFPRHVLTNDSIIRMLRKVSASGGGDFHIYGSIARLPSQRQSFSGAPPQDQVEAAILEVLQRFPPFPSLKRVRAGLFFFGRVEVEFALRGSNLTATVVKGATGLSSFEGEMPAEEFFSTHGPEEFPAAADLAVQSSGQSPNGTPSTVIEAHSTLAAPLAALPPNAPMESTGLNSCGMGLITLGPRGPANGPVRGSTPPVGRFEPYPGGSTQPTFGRVAPFCPPPSAYGVEDEEI